MPVLESSPIRVRLSHTHTKYDIDKQKNMSVRDTETTKNLCRQD